jgi:hypothetical protein
MKNLIRELLSLFKPRKARKTRKEKKYYSFRFLDKGGTFVVGKFDPRGKLLFSETILDYYKRSRRLDGPNVCFKTKREEL